MAADGTIHTYLRRALQQLPWDGPRFAALFGWLSGLAPDVLAEANRTVARMLVPLPESPVDILPHLARAMGIPLYAVHDATTPAGYIASMARLRTTLAVHEVAGSASGLASELALAGLEAPLVEPDLDQTIQAFDVECENSTDPETFGGGATYGDGTIYGRQLPAGVASGVLAVMRYFRPAGARFREIQEVVV